MLQIGCHIVAFSFPVNYWKTLLAFKDIRLLTCRCIHCYSCTCLLARYCVCGSQPGVSVPPLYRRRNNKEESEMQNLCNGNIASAFPLGQCIRGKPGNEASGNLHVLLMYTLFWHSWKKKSTKMNILSSR